MSSKLLKFFISFQLLIIVFAGKVSFASDNPLIDLGLSQEQVIDILNVCFSQTLDCRFLVRKVDGKLEHILLIGERHTQRKESYILGAKLLKHYTIIGQETGTKSRFYDYCPTFLAQYVKKLNLEKGNYSFSNFSGENQETFNLEKGYRTKIFQSDSKSNILDLFFVCGGILLSFSGLNLIDQIVGSLWAIYGTYDYYEREQKMRSNPNIDIMHEEMPERDELMAMGLLEKLSSSSSNGIVGVMGTGHLYGVARALIKSGFSNRGQDLMTQYESFMSDKEISKFLLRTEERDHTNLKTCSVLFDCELDARKHYPEDFILNSI